MARQGRRPHLNVTIGLGTLAGLDELPGTLAGFGAIPADVARSIAASAGSITTLLTDPESGAVVGAGELTYRPRQALRDLVAAVTDTCQFPSCRQPVWRCDIDHRTPFDHQRPERGGPTGPSNTGPMCRRHHLFKHHTDWRVSIDPAKLLIQWTSPTGHTYTKKARQAVTPDIRVSTPGSGTARRLDEIGEMCSGGQAATVRQVLTRFLDETAAAHGGDRAGTDGHTDVGRSSPDTTASTDRHRDSADQSTTGHIGRSTTGPVSRFEDSLTDALLRHSLTGGPEIEYDPDPGADTDTDGGEDDDEQPPF